MTLRDRSPGRRSIVVLVAAVFLAGNLAFYLWYRGTIQDREHALETRRAQLEKEVEAADAEAARLSGQRARLSQVSTAISEFYEKRVGSAREGLAPLVEEVHTVLRRVGIAPAQIAYSTAGMKDLPLSEMKIAFSFKNDYSKVKQLLAELESDRRWIVVREIGLSRDPDFPGGVQVRVNLSTYFSAEPVPPAARAASASARIEAR